MSAERSVTIRFDCLPFRSIHRWDVPLDASPRFRAKCLRIQAAAEKHGAYNTYYLHEGVCSFRLTNHGDEGLLEFAFEGTVSTDAWDEKTIGADLQIELRREACDWLTEPVVRWFKETVERAVILDFDRYLAAGDGERSKQRLALAETELQRSGGYVGLGL